MKKNHLQNINVLADYDKNIWHCIFIHIQGLRNLTGLNWAFSMLTLSVMSQSQTIFETLSSYNAKLTINVYTN